MFGRIRNTALLFVICSVFLSGHIIKESIIAYEYKTSLKQEQLSSVSRMMNELADYIESKDNRGIDILSDMILRCGYVNSFSNQNKAYVYDYLSFLRSGREYDIIKSSAYARACSKCAISELNCETFSLERYINGSDINTNKKYRPKYQYGQSNRVIDYGETTCSYSGNIYTKIQTQTETVSEHVSLVPSDNLSINIPIDMMLVTAIDESEYVFSDMKTDFYRTNVNDQYYLVGFDELRNIRYYKLVSVIE